MTRRSQYLAYQVGLTAIIIKHCDSHDLAQKEWLTEFTLANLTNYTDSAFIVIPM